MKTERDNIIAKMQHDDAFLLTTILVVEKLEEMRRLS